MGLGLSGAFGAKAAADALRVMQIDADRRQQISDALRQQAIDNAFKERTVHEGELTGGVNRSSTGLHDTLDVNADTRAQTLADQVTIPTGLQQLQQARDVTYPLGKLNLRAAEGRQNVIEGLTPVQRQMAETGLTFEDVADPEAIAQRGATAGRARGLGLAESFKSGGGMVENATEGPNSPRTLSGLRLLHERAAEDRLTDAQSPRNAPSAPGQTPGAAYQAERSNRVLASVDELSSAVSPFTVGVGSLLSRLPATAARDFEAKLNTLKGNIAFGELTAMREASKTGGALGAISEKEIALLESSLGALDTKQSPAQFREQLQKIRGSIERWQKAAQQQGGGTPAPGRFPAVGADGVTYYFPSQAVADEFKKRGG